MKNKFNETGTYLKDNYNISTDFSEPFLDDSYYCCGQSINSSKIEWSDPAASKKVILELLGLVNYKEEYDSLLEELAQIELIEKSALKEVKGGVN
jgi:hypothetical protein